MSLLNFILSWMPYIDCIEPPQIVSTEMILNLHCIFKYIHYSIYHTDCARDQKIFEEAGLSFTLACTGNGNYDNVQGMNGRIFCVDPNGYPLTDYFDSIFGLDCNQYLYSKVTEPLDDDDDYDD